MMNRKTEIGFIEADNPWFASDHAESAGNPKRIGVHVNVKESAIVSLAVRGYLKSHQMRAASRFRESWEIMNGMHSGGGERVDNRAGSASLPDNVVFAGRDLRQCRDLLGQRAYALVVAVCGKGYAIPELFSVKRDRLTATDVLRASLDDMACSWGYMRKARTGVLTNHGNHL